MVVYLQDVVEDAPRTSYVYSSFRKRVRDYIRSALSINKLPTGQPGNLFGSVWPITSRAAVMPGPLLTLPLHIFIFLGDICAFK